MRAASIAMPQNTSQTGWVCPRPKAAARISSLEKKPEKPGTPAIAKVAISMSQKVQGR